MRCFRRAAEYDPSCAMAYWGIAYAAGPNYNKQWKAFDPVDLKRSLDTAHGAARQALELVEGASPVEQALIRPLAQRYPSNDPEKVTPIWNDDYAESDARGLPRAPGRPRRCGALRRGDHEPHAVAAVGYQDGQAGRRCRYARGHRRSRTGHGATARHAASGPAPHVHSPHGDVAHAAEGASGPADALRDLVPDAGHLVHMATHIDVLCGLYKNVVDGNSRAIAADRKYLAREGANNFYSLYRCHDYHFKLYGAMFLGQLQPALEAANEMIATLPEELLRIESPPMADWLEGFVPMKMHVLIRFGRWIDIIATPLPADRELFCVTTAMIHYAKAVAHAASGNVEAAEDEARHFDAAFAKVPPSRYVFNNTCLDILAIAAEMMRGEIEYRKGHFDTAFAHLRKSVELDDNLPYDEPWGWMQPTRHALGALLLEQGACGGSGDGLPRRSRPRRHPGASLSASRKRLEPAWLSRMPDATGQARRSPHHQAASRHCHRLGRRTDQVFLFLPDGNGGMRIGAKA